MHVGSIATPKPNISVRYATKGRCNFANLVRVLTAKLEEIAPEEGRFVELLDLFQVLLVDIFAQGSLPSRFVRDQRLEHRADHVELGRGRAWKVGISYNSIVFKLVMRM